MQRIITSTGNTAGDGLLKRALELRYHADQAPTDAAPEAPRETPVVPTGDDQKKKLSPMSWKNAA